MLTLRSVLTMLCAAALPAAAAAQGTTLTVSGLPLTFPPPAGADFAAGYIESATLTNYLIEAAQTGPNTQRTVILSVRSIAVSGGATLEWRRADLATWTALGATSVDVDQATLRKGQAHSNAIVWRYLLGWNVPPGTTTYSIALTLTVTVP